MRLTAVWDFLWGRPMAVLMSLALTIWLYADQANDVPLGVWILALCLVVHATGSGIREKNAALLLGRRYENIQRRVQHLLGDLAGLSGDDFTLWMIDVYVPHVSVRAHGPWRFVIGRTLRRALSLSLTDLRTPPNRLQLNHELFGQCFRSPSTALWWDTELVLTPSSEINHSSHLSTRTNFDLQQTFGIVSVCPIVDGLGEHCRGLLLVHADRNPLRATQAFSALSQHAAKRHLLAACQDIHARLGSQ